MTKDLSGLMMSGVGERSEGRRVPAGRLGKNEALVLSVLQKADRPLGAYEILDDLRDAGLKAPLQIYRALKRLQAAGQVHRLESLNAFVFCHLSCAETSHPEKTIFMICDRCGYVSELHDEAVFSALSGHARKRSFAIASTMIELHGVCVRCL